VSVVDAINANTQAVIAGKTNLTTAIIEKGGTIDQAGALPTFSELAKGIESISGGGSGGGSGFAPLPVTNVAIERVDVNQLKVSWKLPDVIYHDVIQIRLGINYIPSLPEKSTDIIFTTVLELIEEVFIDIDLSSLTATDFVGVWVTPATNTGAVQTIRTHENTASTTTEGYHVTETISFSTGMVVDMLTPFFVYDKITTKNSDTSLPQSQLDNAIYYLQNTGELRCCIPYVEGNYKVYSSGTGNFACKTSYYAGTHHTTSIYKYDMTTRKWTRIGSEWAYAFWIDTSFGIFDNCPVNLYDKDDVIVWEGYTGK